MRKKLAIIGLGYVGLPLLVKLSDHYDVLGYDIDQLRINELNRGYDRTGEISKKDLGLVGNQTFSSNKDDLRFSQIFIVTVPTPVDIANNPDLSLIKKACFLIAEYLKKDDIVIFESTVFPGATREVCIPILEKISGLKLNIDFGVGYSPERINPGDKKHNIQDVVKITSGSNAETLKKVDEIYKKIINAGTFQTSSIEVAEAAKIIENTQRDINIALMNELSIIFNKLNISSKEILEAAMTKWNFLNFNPGLVGGHCIGVDPYYLTYKAMEIGYKPELILAGRKINDSMPIYVVSEFIKLAVKKNVLEKSKRILVMGITFKENCPDIRNSKSIEIVNELLTYALDVDIFDPVANSDDSIRNKNLKNITSLTYKSYAGIIVSVAHEEFKKIDILFLRSLCIEDGIIFDVKNLYPSRHTDLRL
tara:strand:- start:44967 stop:46232 length:1266 start_codon:yes stop_codon:yes gene_type:complete